MVNIFDQCTDSCGWVAALVAALAYGSFGVPVKATKHIDVHPLVLQSYKTVVVFISCWLMPLFGVEVSFTKWGLLSGLLWVIGGTGGTAMLADCVAPCISTALLNWQFLCSFVLFRNIWYPNGWSGHCRWNVGIHHDHGQFHLWNFDFSGTGL